MCTCKHAQWYSYVRGRMCGNITWNYTFPEDTSCTCIQQKFKIIIKIYDVTPHALRFYTYVSIMFYPCEGRTPVIYVTLYCHLVPCLFTYCLLLKTINAITVIRVMATLCKPVCFCVRELYTVSYNKFSFLFFCDCVQYTPLNAFQERLRNYTHRAG